MTGIAARIVLLDGWRRLAVAAAAGGVAALSMPPLNLLPALLIAFPAAVWLVDGAVAGSSRFAFANLKAAFVAGWGFGFGYFLGGLWWLGAAFLVEDDQFAWALPLGVVGLPAALALFHAAGFALARLLWSEGPLRILAFAGSLALAEWLRGFVLTGFPWNSFGQALGATDWTAQTAALVGLEGMTLLVLLIFAAPATLATAATRRGRWVPTALALSAFVALAAHGVWRLPSGAAPTVADVGILIMQPNIGQREKNRLTGQEVLTRYISLTAGADGKGAGEATHIFWPESPFPFLLSREPSALGQIAAMLKPKATLVTGAARAEDAPSASGRPRYFNSIHVVGPDGVIVDSYDKAHLVPFGEYLPFRDLFQRIGLRQFVEVPGGFEAGARRKLLSIRGLPPAVPLICYEAIFPAESAIPGPRAGLLVNVTNDGWFGRTFGPHQHLAQARLRAIEQGLPMVRAANTGISAIIDPYGRVVRSLPLGVQGVVAGSLPQALNPPISATKGGLLFLGALLACMAMSALRLAR
jgi:apolipoprotein N-acyltransferase